MDLFKQPVTKRLKRISSPSSADNFISSALSSSLSNENGGNKDPKDTMLTSDQKSRMEFNKSLAKAKMNLKLCSDNANGDGVGYVKLEELLVEETWLEALPGEFQKPYAKNFWGGCGRRVPSVYNRIPEGQHCQCKDWPGVQTTGDGEGSVSGGGDSGGGDYNPKEDMQMLIMNLKYLKRKTHPLYQIVI
uniref:Uncharacterized protein LOC104224332 n=2 Tax=Nicotiana sylvestris TaxID=4096 RepID=A0A1U7WHY3_NICSY|nr:PREDICTED: uncharacterized protein LOC104224332 [Nicotiana sylvestris]